MGSGPASHSFSLCSISPGMDAPKDLRVGNVTQESMIVYWSAPIAAFDHYRISYRAAEGNGLQHSCSCPELTAANPPSIQWPKETTRSSSPRQHLSALGKATNNWDWLQGRGWIGCLE